VAHYRHGAQLPERAPRYASLDRDEILRVFAAFRAAGLEYTLIGATAMGLHGVVRATEDIDLFIRATADNVERLRQALRAAYGDDPSIEEITAADLLGDYPAVRYYRPSGDLYFDVMTRLVEAASFDTVDAEVKIVAGTPVSVATPQALYRLKKNRVRARDREDAVMLRQRFGLRDEA
jgi:acylphosphatase